ncbi:MAG: hypothetical protein A3G75_11320 [Verrucomicrobia bacterium RIFCSPLOWO2_12_FULL_64_8]|nr:MAG: hypothetical protein A3G75_11320 [Verrucomicrobia bacterium RIFCSPLOWO2_12_FULL_64_8]
MELNLQPLASACNVSGRAFAAGDRVVSQLVRTASGDVVRHDVLAGEEAGLRFEGHTVCRWVHVFKPKPPETNPERTLKLTAGNLFLALADPANEPTPANTSLLQFLALMLERKRVLRLRGRTPDGERNRFEHMPSHQIYEVPVGDMSPEFFAKIQEQLGALTGGRRKEPAPAPEAR